MNIDPWRDPPKSSSQRVDFNSQSLLDAVPDAMLVLDRAGRIVIANVHAEELFGYTYEQLIEKSVEELMPARFRVQHLRHRKRFFGDARARPMGVGLELSAIRGDGTEIPVDISLSPVAIGPETFVIAAIRDVTEQRRAEEQKNSEAVEREGEERFQAIIDTAPALIWMSGPDKACTYVNKTWLDFTGRSIEAELASSWAEGIHPDDLQRCMDTYTQSFDRREKFRTEYRLRRHDGEYRWVLDEGVPRFNQDGSLAGYIGIGIDITDHKLAERKITLANDRFRLAMESGKSVAWEWDVQSGRDSWFGDLKTMFGIPSDTYVGNVEDFRRRVHSEDRGLVGKAINDAMRGHAPYAAEFRVVWPDGTVRWVAAKGKFYYSKEGKPERMLGVASDITDVKKTELALRESEERLRLAAQTGKMLAYEWDAATDVIVRSEGAARILGVDEGPCATGQHILTMIPPEDREKLIAAIAQLTPEEPNLRISHRMRRSDGTVIWVERTSRAHFDEQGKMVRIVGIMVDITERKLAERKLAQANERLRLALASGKLTGWDRDVKSGRDSLFGDLQGMFGIPSEVYDGRVEDFHRYLHAEDRRRVVEAIDYAMETHKPYAAEFRLRWPDGTVRWLAAKGKFYYSQNGEPERMLGIAVDITDRKLAEEALRESEGRFRLAAQAGRMYAFDWDVVTDVIVRSEESNHVFGLTAEPIRLTKHELLERVHPEDRTTFINSIVECTPESPNTQISYRLLRPDGSLLWLERTGHAFFDEQGRMVRMVGMVTDITERKLAENKLQEYERVVEGLEEMMVVVDREYRYLIANNKFLTMRNMTKEQVVGRFAHEVLNKGVFEALVKEKLDECFQGKVVRYEMKYTYPKLGERDILVSYFPIEGETGVDRVACIAQDITERKLAEEALSTVSQKLIEAQEKERTRIAMELHDDVGQRLSLLAVNLDRLKQSRPTSAAELGLQIEEVRKQIDDLASDVQALSHRLHSPKLDYLGLAPAAASFCRELSDRHGMEIEFHSENIPKELPKEISLCLYRVLQEALQNAIKHSGSRQFHASLTGGANEIELTVHDSGVGFEPEEAIKGRGLGLTSMKERLRVVDGELSIDSQLQRGTTIHARVPLGRDGHSMGAAG